MANGIQYKNIDSTQKTFNLYSEIDRLIEEIKIDFNSFEEDHKKIASLLKRGEYGRVECQIRLQCLCYDLYRLYHTLERYESIDSIFLHNHQFHLFKELLRRFRTDLDVDDKFMMKEGLLLDDTIKEELKNQGRMASFISSNHKHLMGQFTDNDYIRLTYSSLQEQAERGLDVDNMTPQQYKSNFAEFDAKDWVGRFMKMSAEILNQSFATALLLYSLLTATINLLKKLTTPLYVDNTPKNHDKVLNCYLTSKNVLRESEKFKLYWQEYLLAFRDKHRRSSEEEYKHSLFEAITEVEDKMRLHLMKYGIIYPGDDNLSILSWDIYSNLNSEENSPSKTIEIDDHMQYVLLIEMLKNEYEGKQTRSQSQIETKPRKIEPAILGTVFSPTLCENIEASKALIKLVKEKLDPSLCTGKRADKWTWGHVQKAFKQVGFVEESCDNAAFGRAMVEINGKLKAENVKAACHRFTVKTKTNSDKNLIAKLVTELTPIKNMLTS